MVSVEQGIRISIISLIFRHAQMNSLFAGMKGLCCMILIDECKVEWCQDAFIEIFTICFVYGLCHVFLPEASYGLRVLSLPASVCVCVCMCVCVSVNHQFVRTITCHPLKLQSPNLDQKCKTPWLRSLLFLGFIDLDLQGQIELKSKNLPHFGLVSLSGRQVNTKWSEAFQI